MNDAGVTTTSAPRRGLGRATPVAVLALVLPITGSVVTIIAGAMIANWLRAQGVWGVVYFTITFAVLGALALAPTNTTSIIAGWTFGFSRGFIAVIIGTVGGAALCHLTARRVAGRRVQEAFRDHPKWELVRRALLEEHAIKTLWIVFLMRVSPILPFGTTNVLLATTGVKFWIYILGTLLGLAPRLALVALAAAGAERLDLDVAESRWMLAAGIFATGLCIAVLAFIGRRALRRATST